MTAPNPIIPFSNTPQSAPKKRVLLLDSSQAKRDLRADVMRKLGIEVDCAADVLEARCWWKAALYHLVLVGTARENISRDEFCLEIRAAIPPQRIAFFVGGPQYLATMPLSENTPTVADDNAPHQEIIASLFAQEKKSSQQRWGIMEACKKISSVRAVSEARSRAMRELPRPSRWAEAIEQHSAIAAAVPPLPITEVFPRDILTEREGLL